MFVNSLSCRCLMKAPLILGTDLTNMSATTLATITNEAAIAVPNYYTNVELGRVFGSEYCCFYQAKLSTAQFATWKRTQNCEIAFVSDM